ncbi:MAG: hypothetical protein U0U67_07900 [Chitinophagales bacterium]
MIIFITTYTFCNSQTNGFNYNLISVPCDSNGRQIYYNDSVIVYRNLYNKSTTCRLYKNGHLEIFDSSNHIIESGFLNFTCSQRCSRFNFWNEYYKSGKLKACGNYKKDHKINTWKYFYESGNLFRIENYPYDDKYRYMIDGFYYVENPMLLSEYEYYENGQLKMEGQYTTYSKCIDTIYYIDPVTLRDTISVQEVTCSKKCGTWNYYFPDGSLMKREEY